VKGAAHGVGVADGGGDLLEIAEVDSGGARLRHDGCWSERVL
jgi:hypothetical protein